MYHTHEIMTWINLVEKTAQNNEIEKKIKISFQSIILYLIAWKFSFLMLKQFNKKFEGSIWQIAA